MIDRIAKRCEKMERKMMALDFENVGHAHTHIHVYIHTPYVNVTIFTTY